MLGRKVKETPKEDNIFEARITLDMNKFKDLHHANMLEVLHDEFRAIQEMALRELKRVQSEK